MTTPTTPANTAATSVATVSHRRTRADLHVGQPLGGVEDELGALDLLV
jgi:hypothetical protein